MHGRLAAALGLCLLAGAVFLHGMADFSLWQDEGWTVLVALQKDWPAMRPYFEQDNHPPLYTLLLHGWSRVASDSPFALRALGYFASLLTVALSYHLGYLLYRRAWVGWVAGAFVASSDLVLAYGSVIRHYSLYMLLATLTMLCYWRFQRRWGLGWGLAYTLTGLALLYTLYWGVFLLLAQGLHALLTQPRRALCMAAPALLIALGFAPWLPFVLYSLSGESNYAVSAEGYYLAFSLNRDGLAALIFQLFGTPEAVYLGLAGAGLALSAKEARLFVGAWLALPLLITGGMTAGGFGILSGRPLVALVPAVGLLLGRTLVGLPLRYLSLFVLLFLAHNLTTRGFPIEARGRWWQVAELMSAYNAPQDGLVLEVHDFSAYAIQHHLRIAGVANAGLVRTQQIRKGWVGESAHDQNAAISVFEGFWFIQSLPDLGARPYPPDLGYIQTAPVITIEEAPHIPREQLTTLTRYDRPPQGPPLVRFGESLALYRARTFATAEGITVQLLWGAEETPPVDYSISVFALSAEGGLLAQHDSYPLDGLSPTSTWMVGAFYLDAHSLSIEEAPRLGLRVYTWWDGAILPPTPCPVSVPSCDFFPLEKPAP